MLFAKVALGLAVEGPFDYSVPDQFKHKIKVGSRVEVMLRAKKMVGFVVVLSKSTKIKYTRPILKLIDDLPLLSKNMLLLARRLSQYYYCSLGEAVETMLPESLRKGRVLPAACVADRTGPQESYSFKEGQVETELVYDPGGSSRWERYILEIKDMLRQGRGVIVILPDIQAIERARGIFSGKVEAQPVIIFRKQKGEAEEWLKIKKEGARFILGTRSAVFAPLERTGLIILDEEEDPVYKQEQVPHYHAREVAGMRAKIDKAKLILGSRSPSLESFYAAKRHRIKYSLMPRKHGLPEVKIADTRFNRNLPKGKGGISISKYLLDSIMNALSLKERILVFLDRRGFATLAFCHNCGKVLECPRCKVNLTYHFDTKQLSCHRCNYRCPLPSICPNCNSGYIKYSGAGVERVESELSRIFPQAKIRRLDNPVSFKDTQADIFVSTSLVMKQSDFTFDLIGALGTDNSLNRVDLRSSEKAFRVLSGLLSLTRKKLVVETGFPAHHAYEWLLKGESSVFYEKELKERKQLNFPPFQRIALLKLRGKAEDKVKEKSLELFEKL
ncbi:MAG TPA: primosomal protein N', partial [Candidatus Margulisiibacteriota bacterium]|nr:primosomal protein N' [Candidatus Margulisiibacteriota bacterium]